jgi:hypothetical protein
MFENPLTLMSCVTQAQVVAAQELTDRLDLQGYHLRAGDARSASGRTSLWRSARSRHKPKAQHDA